MEAYVDDLVIKSKMEHQMFDDIQETFKNLRKVNMKLNPEKCSFGFEEGKFLGHIVGKQSIKANPNKVKVVLEAKPPKTKKETTNNEAEYEALIAGLRLAKEMKVQKLEVFTDSLLVSSQVNDSYVAKEPNMRRYKEKSKELMNTFQMCTIKQIPRSQNKKADALSKLASLTFAHLTKKVLVEVLKVPSIDELEIQDGMDIVGPFPPSKGGVKFLPVAVDYFTKWPEVKPLEKITGKQVIDFVWENIICRYGLRGVLVTDNGKQFAEKPFSSWCKEYRINQVFSSVAYPQSNGQVERTNRSIVEVIKTRLGRYESN
ncbi:uncharacterized protein K02A2.6-like [Helianthus annuus]|uniref:uncharacterized protein K02A2.6-like n=1 Tax=Helianthus annuus TaxID=4232 RepID=UPI000B906A9F|nr:uncharacterized protein K02A2.6-like [Helianthus annuus]